ncbi:MAG: hypothetical protein NVS1B6_00600 [Steroidobacteraceae bacterium]
MDYWPEGQYLETVFPDGATVPAAPQDTDEYRATAEDLGYGADTMRLCLEHEVLHTAIAELRGESFSQVLRDVADGKAGEASHGEEETRVLNFQKLLNQLRLPREQMQEIRGLWEWLGAIKVV